MRRPHYITKKAKISSTPHVHCYKGYMVNNNNNPLNHGVFPERYHMKGVLYKAKNPIQSGRLGVSKKCPWRGYT